MQLDSSSLFEITQVLARARCLLWQADVQRDGQSYRWNTVVRNTAAAAQFLPVEIPPGGDYSLGFLRSKLPEEAEQTRLTGEHALFTGQTGYRQDYRLRLESGEIRWLFEDVSIEALESGRWRLTGVCTDVTDQKKAQEEVEQVLERARCVLWQATVRAKDGDFVWDVRFRNPAAANRFLPVDIPSWGGYRDGFHYARPSQYIEMISRNSRAALRSGQKGYQQEFPIRIKAGETRWISEDVSIEPLETGTWLLTGVCTDITERKRVESAMSQVQASARCLLWRATVVDIDGILDWSIDILNQDAAQELLAIEILPGVPYSTSLHYAWLPEYRERGYQLSAAALRSGLDSYEQEFPIRTAEGQIRWLAESAKIEFESERRWSLTGVCVDITDRKNMEMRMQMAQEELQDRVDGRTQELQAANAALQAEIAERQLAQEELKASEARYRAVVEDQTEFISRFLRDGTFIFLNEALCRYYGKARENLLGTSFLDMLPPEAAETVRTQLALLSPENPVGSYEVSSANEEGEIRRRRWTTRYIADESGKFICFQSVGRDVTEQIKSQEALVLAKEEAERANRAKSEFLSRMSHELRTPLNAILGFGQYLDRNDLRPVQRESVQHILKGGKHLLELINEILDLSKVESGRTDVSLEPVSIAELVRESVALLGSLGEEHDVHLIVDLDALKPCFAMADQQRLKQVLINLLSNGIKYNRPGGSVTLSCLHEGDQLHVDVIDTGIGIHPDDVPKLFRPFERLAAANTAVEGTGLGLALSHKLVELMGGSLTMESEWERGSKFRISLPTAASPTQQLDGARVEQGLTAHGLRGAKRFSVLCIEDNPSNLRLIEVILASRPGVELSSAAQGSAGLELARRLIPDVILLDLNLPDMSGRQVLEQLRSSEQTKSVPVIVISADATPQRRARLLTLGADAYLTKPLDVGEFLSALDKFLK